MKSEIVIRADGSPEIGLGHLIRCSALALMLKDDFNISFYYREIPEEILEEIKSYGFQCIKINNEEEFLNELSDNNIVVLDGYDFSTDYQKKIKAAGSKLVCIDDLHDKEFVADLIINQAPGIKSHYYKAQPTTQFALGLDYVLLRPGFLEQARKHRTIEVIKNVFICFGGSDPQNLTKEVLQTVIGFTQFNKIIVVIGAAYLDEESLISLINCDPRIDLRQNLNEKQMIEAMSDAELAIVPASGVLFEALAAGCNVISGTAAENQKYVYEHLKNSKLFVDAGKFSRVKLNESITSVMLSHPVSYKCIDGLTGCRVLKLFRQLQNETIITLRNVKPEDLDVTYKWAINSEIRRFSIQQHIITRREHINWFVKKIKNKSCLYYIAEINSIPIGSIRFDLTRQKAIISYLLDPEYHGRGYGQIILKKGIERCIHAINSFFLPVSIITGDVMRGNIPSLKAFERAGFIRKEIGGNFRFEKRLYNNK
jgi:UDP-2,4-diacetamido-2,4,6-trideoxy-beta-L-altropyranose hydrolase